MAVVREPDGTRRLLAFPTRLFAGPPKDTTQPQRVSLVQPIERVRVEESDLGVELVDLPKIEEGRKVAQALEFLISGSEEEIAESSNQGRMRYSRGCGLEANV